MRMRWMAAAAGRAALCALVMLWPAATASAQTGRCSFSTTSVNFGAYDVFASAPSDTTGTITYRCDGAANVVVAITAGLGGSFAPRSLVGGTEALSYNLFRDAARTSVWGTGSGGAHPVIVGDPSNRTEQTLTIYARIPAGQDVRAGSYSDSVTVVILY